MKSPTAYLGSTLQNKPDWPVMGKQCCTALLKTKLKTKKILGYKTPDNVLKKVLR
jgi:hypothetical protein